MDWFRPGEDLPRVLGAGRGHATPPCPPPPQNF